MKMKEELCQKRLFRNLEMRHSPGVLVLYSEYDTSSWDKVLVLYMSHTSYVHMSCVVVVRGTW